MMDRVTDALRCYVYSAEILDKQIDATSILNQGFAALWIGTASEQLGDFQAAYIFYRKAAYIWSKRAPLRLTELTLSLDRISPGVDERLRSQTDSEIDGLCVRWLKNFGSRASMKF